jgi:hypothetical protein
MKDIAVMGLLLLTIVFLCGVGSFSAGLLTWAFLHLIHPSISFLPCLKLGFLELVVLVAIRMAYKEFKN